MKVSACHKHHSLKGCMSIFSKQVRLSANQSMHTILVNLLKKDENAEMLATSIHGEKLGNPRQLIWNHRLHFTQLPHGLMLLWLSSILIRGDQKLLRDSINTLTNKCVFLLMRHKYVSGKTCKS